jgi:uncharacterized protein YkwD
MNLKKYVPIFCLVFCFVSTVLATQFSFSESIPLDLYSSDELITPQNSPILTNPGIMNDCIPCQNKITADHMVVKAPKAGLFPPPEINTPNNTSTQILSEIGSSEVSIESGGYYIGVFRNRQWHLDVNANRRWDGTSTDRTTNFGLSTDIPVSKYFVGVFRNGAWYLDTNLNGQWDGPSIDAQYSFGLTGDIPVYGMYTGGTNLHLGVFRNTGYWYIDWNHNGRWDGAVTDKQWRFGLPGDKPVVADWSGSGVARIGVFRSGYWYVDWNGNGQWDGTSIDRRWKFGLAGDIPVVGDWSGTGVERIGVFRNGQWYIDWNNNHAWDGAVTDRQWSFGLAGDKPHVRHVSYASGTGTVILTAHNTWRSEVGTPAQTWSGSLETTAQRWATYMATNDVFSHSPKDGYYRYGSGGTYAGENIAWASYDRSWTDIVSHLTTTSWAGTEKQYYNHANTFPNCCIGGTCSHYTQVIWLDSTQIGCGKAYVPGNGYYYVCQYWSPGNYIGQKPY